MADSPRLQILLKLTALLETTSVTLSETAGGELANMTGLVYRGRSLMGEESGPIALSITEVPREGYGEWAADEQARKEMWPLQLIGRCPQDHPHPVDSCYELLEAVELVLGRVVAETEAGDKRYPLDYHLGFTEGITKFEFGPGVVLTHREEASSAFFYLPIRVGLAVDIA